MRIHVCISDKDADKRHKKAEKSHVSFCGKCMGKHAYNWLHMKTNKIWRIHIFFVHAEEEQKKYS